MKYSKSQFHPDKYHAYQEGRMGSICGKSVALPTEQLAELPPGASICGSCLMYITARKKRRKREMA